MEREGERGKVESWRDWEENEEDEEDEDGGLEDDEEDGVEEGNVTTHAVVVEDGRFEGRLSLGIGT